MTADPSQRPSDPLALVCHLLNEKEARYIVVGAQACILHGLVRSKETYREQDRADLVHLRELARRKRT